MLETLKRRMATWRPARPVGIAVGPGRLVALTVDRQLRGPVPDRVFRRELAGGPTGDGWPALEEALDELGDELAGDGAGRVRAHVALLPPLARTKGVRLPAARRPALRRLVAREAARHFPSPPDDPVADAVLLERGGDGPSPALAACADRSVARSVVAAAESAGLETGLLSPGARAAAEGARALERPVRRGRVVLELRGRDWRRNLELRDGRLRAVTRVPAGGEPVPVHAGDGRPESGGAEGTDGAPSGPDDPARPRVLRVDAEGEALHGLGPDGLAAFGVLEQPEDGLLLLPDAARSRWTRRLRTRAAALGAAAVALLVAAGGAHLWGLDRELRAVEAARSAISGPVSRVSTAREAADRMRTLLANLRGLRPDRPDWASVVAELARVLPPSSYLDELSATDRGLVLTGSARSPSALITRLADSPLFDDAGLETVTRSRGGEADAFRILVRVRGRSAPAAADTTSRGRAAPSAAAGDTSPGTSPPRDAAPADPPPGTPSGEAGS